MPDRVRRYRPSVPVEEWQLVAERPGSAGYLPVVTRQYDLPDGTQAEWDIFGHERTVAVLAITPNDMIVLARQYRPGPRRILDELPGGFVDPAENVAHAASRELLEETGYTGDIAVIGRTWLAGAARTECFAAVARDARRVGLPTNEPGEFCDTVLVTVAEFRDHLRSGELTDVDVGYLALDHLRLLGPGDGSRR